MTTPRVRVQRPKPLLVPQLCKACGRCIEACPKQCIKLGTSIQPETGLTPVEIDLTDCTGCGLCLNACPEPRALLSYPEPVPVEAELEDLFPAASAEHLPPEPRLDCKIPLRACQPMMLKGTHALAVGALLAGCRHFFGYPITPSTEGAELMARLLPEVGGIFVQTVSEVATVNMMYGCGGAGLRSMTFTSSPGFSLMLEGISYMIGAEVPGVFVNIMRAGPGLGNIAPAQGDVKLACRGLGHGDTHAIVLAPSTPQESLDLTMEAFDLAFKYRNPVIVVGDGYLGQMTGRVVLPMTMIRPGLPTWAVHGDGAGRHNLICSIHLGEADLENHNLHLNRKYAEIDENEQRSSPFCCDDAEWIVITCNTPARMAKGAIRVLRERGILAGLFRPVRLWPFPMQALQPLLGRAHGILVVEAGNGQIEDELRLALSHRDRPWAPPIHSLRHSGGVLPEQGEIVDEITRLEKGDERSLLSAVRTA
jgi:pyruvate/2-oxoacid:ferredoxin oxidoreductase alpha subunit/NAD-dependent dihydropyrimidine dehydrogenase PreA subunit